ncbi:MAG: hypothetical protein WCJ30_05310 [Deltaproteobacteria bacterium]
MTTDAVPPGEAARRARLRYEVKGTVMRGRAAALREQGWLVKVEKHLDPATLAMVNEPPVTSTWIEGARVAEIDDVVRDVLGDRVLEELAAMTVRRSIGPLLRAAVEGTLRLFGTSPATLFARLDRLSASTVRGMSFSWETAGARGGSMTVTYPGSADVPLSTFISIRAGFEGVFDMCGAKGTSRLAVRSEAPPRNSGRFDISW